LGVTRLINNNYVRGTIFAEYTREKDLV